MRLSVLDQTPVPEGVSRPQALQNTLDLARLADRLGYHRYWLAEHHGLALAGPAPEVLAGPVAAATERIRVGSGGVMLPHYSPFKVAESFSLLAGLYPGRIDLALGRASGTDPLTTYALQRDRRDVAPDDFPQQLAELLAHYDGGMPPDHPFAKLGQSLPGSPERPEIWLLGSSPQSAEWAVQLNLPYAFADFINPTGAPIARSYRERAQDPQVAIGVWAIAADTDAEAERLAASIAMSFAMLRQGRPIPVPPPEKAIHYLAQHGDPHRGRRRIIGSPQTVRAGIEQVAEEYGADEVIVVTITHDHEARRRSYELLADAFGLGESAGADSLASSLREHRGE
jgi:luciferase family oxidoreductase group 1